MASTVTKTAPTFSTPTAYLSTTAAGSSSFNSPNLHRVSFVPSKLPLVRCCIRRSSFNWRNIQSPRYSYKKFSSFASNEEAVEVQTEAQEEVSAQGSEPESEPDIEGIDGAIANDAATESDNTVAEEPCSVVVASLKLYREAFANNDESKVAEVESILKSIEDEKIDFERKVATLSEELSNEKDRVLRISADFDNFRKRTERERLLLVKNAQGEVVENLLSVLDNFERAKTQIKVENEGEEKINNSYQSIYKQFLEILGSLGVAPVETVGKTFDPMLHEAIMREDSTDYEDGVIIEEYRKGFQLGDKLLRPSMVKVSAGPGPGKSETGGPSEDQKEVNETIAEGKTQATVTEE